MTTSREQSAAGHADLDEFVEVGAAEDFADGQMAGYEIGGERVLLARVDGRFYAIGGVCTHERANLDEGALCDNVVYCPLHYSAFDVRSGEVLGPPADRAAPTYAVRVEDGKVLVAVAPGGAPPGATESTQPEAGEGVREEALERALPWHARISAELDRMDWLRESADRMIAGLVPVRRRLVRTGLLDLLHGRWFGHALHPALSDLPIGLWISSLLLYLIGQPQPAAILGVAGVAAALATALTGVADWTVAEGHERRAGLMHGLLMTAALLVEAASSATYYFAGARTVAVVLSAVGLAVTVGAAFLGGHLVFGHGTMVNHTAWPPGPAQWFPTALETELDGAPGRTLAVPAGEKTVLLHRNRDGRISAIHNACSHAGAPLSLGQVCDGVVSCPWHESKFRLSDGGVVRGPAFSPQPVFEVRVRAGRIEVRSRE
ncbi:Rieske 2Fe-2S domain-containing protein [Amycolatopsis alkalitolerans]|uniref:Rieske 2Fe-2S domain-containing protein n=1 Tax=Amycolatopsis alkalitolerans TaxID=2547244 RepID=A0A5C4M2U6_9PSEU|nr:Rieske 2Fe-2S domain-containing protein [Amycolatopsis alkalitolerans]TNC25111.1 Rieske 2Fe-2S domain-containing protein [Amycolatopsis alkalitolerans]